MEEEEVDALTFGFACLRVVAAASKLLLLHPPRPSTDFSRTHCNIGLRPRIVLIVRFQLPCRKPDKLNFAGYIISRSAHNMDAGVELEAWTFSQVPVCRHRASIRRRKRESTVRVVNDRRCVLYKLPLFVSNVSPRMTADIFRRQLVILRPSIPHDHTPPLHWLLVQLQACVMTHSKFQTRASSK